MNPLHILKIYIPCTTCKLQVQKQGSDFFREGKSGRERGVQLFFNLDGKRRLFTSNKERQLLGFSLLSLFKNYKNRT